MTQTWGFSEWLEVLPEEDEMSTKKALEIAINDIEGQLGSEDISPEARKEYSKASKKLRQLLKALYE